ncbi:MAG: hypothetical protein HYR81_01520 [Nitrospirae bacterium]|nr:hypothetical protein [Nitrospirota bacterium]
MKEKMPGLEEFQLGTAYLKEKNYKEAAHYFRKALLFYQENPNQTPGSLLSSYGYATAMGENQIKEGRRVVELFDNSGRLLQRFGSLPGRVTQVRQRFADLRRTGRLGFHAAVDGFKRGSLRALSS